MNIAVDWGTKHVKETRKISLTIARKTILFDPWTTRSVLKTSVNGQDLLSKSLVTPLGLEISVYIY